MSHFLYGIEGFYDDNNFEHRHVFCDRFAGKFPSIIKKFFGSENCGVNGSASIC